MENLKCYKVPFNEYRRWCIEFAKFNKMAYFGTEFLNDNVISTSFSRKEFNSESVLQHFVNGYSEIVVNIKSNTIYIMRKLRLKK